MLIWLQGSLCIAGLMCSTYFPAFVTRAKPFLTFASLLDTCACVGASLASNSDTARSSLGAAVLVPVSPHDLLVAPAASCPYPHMLQTAIRRQLPAQDLLLIRLPRWHQPWIWTPGTIS